MTVTRVYTDQPLRVGEQIELGAGASQHLLKVLRFQKGDQCRLFNGDSKDYTAQLVGVQAKKAIMQIEQEHAGVLESPLAVHLVQGISRGERMDYAIQKSVECGVAVISPVITERCNVKLSAERALKRQRHWQAVAVSAAEQSRRAIVPQVNTPLPLDCWLQQHTLPGFVADTQCQNPLGSDLTLRGAVALVIGPEGGLSRTELERCWASQLQSISLGPRVLRTETACVVALTQLQSRWGDMQWQSND